jgi:hypothetical protein
MRNDIHVPGVSKEAPVKSTKRARNNIWSGIMGIGMGLVIVSIIYSSTVIFLGTDGIVPLIMIAPQVAFVAVVGCIAFYKLFNK